MKMRETRHAMGRMTGQVYDGARRSNAACEINVKSRREIEGRQAGTSSLRLTRNALRLTRRGDDWRQIDDKEYYKKLSNYISVQIASYFQI